jgi:hypothetical protein
MWKNIFIESCVLSALIFGGFYIQSNIIRDEIESSDISIKKILQQKKLMHISGNNYIEATLMEEHVSGVQTSRPKIHLSGKEEKSILK